MYKEKRCIMSKRIDLLVKISSLYYEEGKTQTEISKLMNLSRPTIASMLQEARDTGIVKIVIQHTNQSIINRQNELREKYQLKNVLIATGDSHDVKSEVGSLCASLVEEMLPKINHLGVSWGTTVYEYVQHARYFDYKELSIVPLVGGVGNDNMKYHSNHLAFILSEKYNCKVNYFYAPAVAETLEQKEIFLQTELVSHILDLGQQVDLAILGIGNPGESSTYKNMASISEEAIKELKDKKVIGDIGAVFFDEKGESVETTLSDRMIGFNLEDLKKIPDTVILASGTEKVLAIKALLRKQMIDHLIIDATIAEKL